MSARAALPVDVTDAAPADNAALRALAAACPMTGAASLCITREPDFFALNRLEGDVVRVGVARAPGGDVVGCVAVAARRAWLGGEPRTVACIGDLKVHPACRGVGVVDALTAWLDPIVRAMDGDGTPVLFTVLAGNRPMESRVRPRPTTYRCATAGTIRAWAVPLLWPRRHGAPGLRVTRASAGDLDEMAARWRAIAPMRHFTTDLGRGDFGVWLNRAPGLRITDYLLARRRDGRLAGFVALWNQSLFKQLRVTAWSPRLAGVRRAVNAVAPLVGAARLPAAGESLPCLTAVHLCVAPDEPAVLRALLRAAYRAHRGAGFAFFSIGLDVREPLNEALTGLMAQPTDVTAFVTSPRGDYAGPALGDRPLHHEIALV